MKIGQIAKVKCDILSDKKSYVGRNVRVIDMQQRCEGEYVEALLVDGPEKDKTVFFYSEELERKTK